MVGFVRDATGFEVFELHSDLLAVDIVSRDGNDSWALDFEKDIGDAQAPLLANLELFGFDDLWVDESEAVRWIFSAIHDEEPLRLADLWCGQADAFRGVHRLEHVL